ncbi:MAG: SUMF1/EgtB/PvdO family nonheme iron enzyme [Candidatus Latescibacteria bacterium]|nr:SUMF1/EgtB/PvdO family nonheme iron enzyme [Candidatus Latescibacterota bacterium]
MARYQRDPDFAYPAITRPHQPRPFRPQHYTVYRAMEPIVVDGQLDEEAWAQAPWTADFGHIVSATAYARPHLRTRARLLWDDYNLYAAVELEEPHLVAHVVDKDEEIYDDNDIELFIDVDGDAQNYIELEFNALGTIWDMLLPKEYNRGGLPWSHPRVPQSPPWNLEGMRVAVRAEGSFNYPFDTDTGWTIELSIPWTSLAATDRSGTPLNNPGRVLRANFSRVQYPWSRTTWPITDWKNRGGPCWDWTWSPVLVYNMHACETWGRLVLSDRTPAQAPDADLEGIFDFVAPPAEQTVNPGEMVQIEGGSYPIGPDPSDPQNSPPGSVEVPPFCIDRYPVTNGQYADFLNAVGDQRYYHEDMADPDLAGIARTAAGAFVAVPGKEQYPVVLVDQEGARAYAQWAGKRLPSEYEWEIAARRATGRTYPWGKGAPHDEHANFDFRVGHTTSVGAYPQGRTPEGVEDLAGNVWELVEGHWAAYPWSNITAEPHTRGPLMRGGSWATPPDNLKNGYRDAWKGASPTVGFRCAADGPG